MKKIRVVIGVVCLVAGLALIINHQVDWRGHLHTWQHVPPAEELATSSLPAPENPYAADIARYQSANGDVCGWLDFPDFVNAPVVRGADNEFYLTHDATGNANPNGTAFLDYEVAPETADHWVIYGHNMANGQVFSNLDRLLGQATAESHRRFRLATPTRVWDCEIIGVYDMNLEDPAQFFSYNSWLNWDDEKDARAYLDNLSASERVRLSTPVDKSDQLVTLSTCDNAQKDARILIVAKRTVSA